MSSLRVFVCRSTKYIFLHKTANWKYINLTICAKWCQTANKRNYQSRNNMQTPFPSERKRINGNMSVVNHHYVTNVHDWLRKNARIDLTSQWWTSTARGHTGVTSDDIPLEFLSGRLTSGRSVGDFCKSFVRLTDRCTPLHSNRSALSAARQLL